MIIAVMAILATLNGTPKLIYSYPYQNMDSCKSAKNSLEAAGKYEINSMCMETEVEQKWISSNYQGWVLGMVRINDNIGKAIGSAREIPMSSKAECKTGLLQSMYRASNQGMSDVAFFCFNSTQK